MHLLVGARVDGAPAFPADSCQEPPQIPQDRPASQADQRLTLSHGLRAVVLLAW